MRLAARTLWVPASAALLLFGLARPASAVTVDWVTVEGPANACDPREHCFGTVGVTYQISAFEVTNADYAEFLNAKAADDPLELYDTAMASGPYGYGPSTITRSGTAGSYVYTVSAGQELKPVADVTFYDCVRFANWLHNGQGSGDTETGAYTLLGGTPTPSNGSTVRRNAWATVFLPTRDEWYKAAYYDPLTASYFDYPAGTDTPTVCASPGPTPNTANCEHTWDFGLTEVGSYTGSASPYGTFDQGGNVEEWHEDLNTFTRQARAHGRANMTLYAFFLSAPYQVYWEVPEASGFLRGFRVAGRVPEPGSRLLAITSVLVLAGLHRRRG